MHLDQPNYPEDQTLFKIPHSGEAEQAVLGALLTDPAKLDDLDDLLPDHFYGRQNTIIFL